MLPSLVKLQLRPQVGAPNDGSKAAKLDPTRYEDVPAELRPLITLHLARPSLESLKDVVNFCSSHKNACSEEMYKTVVETCFGPAPRLPVPLIITDEAVSRMRLMGEARTRSRYGTFFQWLMEKCLQELTYLPRAAIDSFLQSTEQQRRRWEHSFFMGEFKALHARLRLADLPNPLVVEPNVAFRDILFDFKSFLQVPVTFQAQASALIEQGWGFDQLAVELLRQNSFQATFRANDSIINTDPIQAGTTEYYQAVIRTVEGVQRQIEDYYEPRLEMVMSWGAMPVIHSVDLNTIIPFFKHLRREDHYQLQIFAVVLRDIRTKKMRIALNSVYVTQAKIVLRILETYFGLEPLMESWMDDLKLIRFNRPLFEERAALETTAFIDHFDRYAVEVKAEIVNFLIYMNTLGGCSEWDWVRKFTLTMIEEHTDWGQQAAFNELKQTLESNGFEPFSMQHARTI